MNEFSRLEAMIKKEAMEKLKNSKVAIFGIGGVGGYVLEALVRSNVGEIDIIDNDKVAISNINRQIIALHSTLNEYKTDVAKKRALDINPMVKINTYNIFFSDETSDKFDFTKYDYVIDAIDYVKGKIEIIQKATNSNVPVISSMGMGNKMHPEMIEVEDIYKTSVCPLAKVIRQELRKRNIKNLKVVYSKELPIKTDLKVPSSNAFVPSCAGLIIASVVIRDLIEV